MRLKQFLIEANYKPWVEPTMKSVKDSVITFKDDISVTDTYNKFKNGPVKLIPYSYFKGDGFEPFTLKDLKDPSLEPRVKRIVKGFKENTIPMLLADSYKGKIRVLDGFTRAGVAIALKIPIYAKVFIWDKK